MGKKIAALLGGLAVIAALGIVVFPDALSGLRPSSISSQEAKMTDAQLFAAAEHGDAGAIKMALGAGADINARDAEGWGALLIAASGGKLEAVEVLVVAGADVNAATLKGETPLMGAVLSESEDIVKLLLAKGADKTVKSQSGLTAADFAKKKANAKLAALLGDGDVEKAEAEILTSTPIPARPIGEPSKIALPDGLTLFDWINAASGRIDKGKAQDVLAEGGKHLRRHGPHKSLLKVLDGASTKIAKDTVLKTAEDATAAIPQLQAALKGGNWPALLLKLGNAHHMLEQYDEARAAYGKWLTASAADDPQRGQVVRWQLMVNDSAALTAKDMVAVTTDDKKVASGNGAPSAQKHKAGETIKDCPECPEMVVVPAGSFLMGSPATEEGRFPREDPQHRVTINYRFAVGKYEVTQAEWEAVMGDNPSYFKGKNRPVDGVTWNNLQAFISKLNAKTGKKYRLPTEAEWEYAARAGTDSAYSFGDDANQLGGQYGWFDGNSGGVTHPVGEKKPNAFGLYDMHGNVWEWTEDCDHNNYHGAPTDGSAWMVGGDCSRRVIRSGSWRLIPPWFFRSATRHPADLDIRQNDIGLRLARTL